MKAFIAALLAAASLNATALSDHERLAIERRCATAHLQAAIDSLRSGDAASVKRDAEPLHPGATQKLSHRPPFYNEITLRDGSIWEVKKQDRKKIKDWYPNDPLIFYPNDSLFSGAYNLRLYNEKIHNSVHVKLLVQPFYNGKYTYWITEIDSRNSTLTINDATIWDISGWDSEKLSYWEPGHTVIIGRNDSWFGSRPYILINAATQTYVYADCSQD